MNVRPRQVFDFNGKEFSSLDKVQGAVDDAIGKLIDIAGRELPVHNQLSAAQKLVIHDMITSNRAELIKLLETCDDVQELRDELSRLD